MSGICRLHDITAGACGCCSVTNIGANSNVLINGLPPAKVGDLWGNHGCDCDHSSEHCVAGVSSVLINGCAVVNVGTILSNGDLTITGSGNVTAG